MQKIGDLIKDAYSYYSFDFSDEGFEGVVINLPPDLCRAFYHLEGSGDEDKFRRRLEKMDEWFQTKPYAVQKNWAVLVKKWLGEKKKERDDD